MLVYVLRHAESAAMRWRMDNPDAHDVIADLLPDSRVGLSTLGFEQVDALALFFASLPLAMRPTHAFGSPFTRTHITGIGALAMIDPPVSLVLDERLREIEFGIFARLTKKGRAARFPHLWEERKRVGKVHHRPPEGENWHDVAARLDSFKCERLDVLPEDAVVFVSTHEAVVSISQWKWGEEDIDVICREGVPSASISTYQYQAGRFKLLSKNILPPSPNGTNLYSMEAKT